MLRSDIIVLSILATFVLVGLCALPTVRLVEQWRVEEETADGTTAAVRR